jgi:hypothetical protein
MWRAAVITIEVEDVDEDIVLVNITIPVGTVDLVGRVTLAARTMTIEGAHVGGLSPGALGREGLNAVGRKMLEEADVDEIIIQGSTRTTGRRAKKTPRCIRFPRR